MLGSSSRDPTTEPGVAAGKALPGGEGLIAYVAANPDHDQSLEIFTISRDGTARTNFTNDPARDQDPAWSPDGSRLAFASTRDGAHLDIWVADADGSGLTNLTPLPDTTGLGESGTEPAWSPDGTKIAYVYQGDVWTMDAASGAGKVNLTEDPAIATAGQSPAWSPDGSTIAYVRSADIWMMAANGAGKRRVTSTTGSLSTEKNPDWSPDGRRLVYERSGRIWTMNRDGSQQTAISSGGGTAPVWSPEGDRVTFSSSGYTAPNGPDLFVSRPDGSGVTRIPGTGPTSDITPAWQPLGTTAAAPTFATIASSEAYQRIFVTGELFDANPGQLVRVDLQRHDGTRYQLVQKAHAELSEFGDYFAMLSVPNDSTTCRLVARYGGDADSLPTTRSVVIDCLS